MTILLAFPAILLAQGTSTGAGFLKLPLAARNAALGEAVVADDSHFSSVLVNPSVLAGTQGIEFSVAHQEWIQDVQSEFLAVRAPVWSGSAAFSVSTTSIRGIEVREVPGAPIGTFTAHSAVFAGSVATPITDDLRVGISVKYLYEKIFVDEASGVAFDAGVIIRTPVEGLSAGASLLHAGSAGKLRERRADLPTRMLTGLAYSFSTTDFDIRTLGAFSYGLNSRSLHLHTGLQASYQSTIAVRLGYLSGHESRGLSGGLGLSYQMFLFDYAFVPFSLGLGSAHLATIGVRF